VADLGIVELLEVNRLPPLHIIQEVLGLRILQVSCLILHSQHKPWTSAAAAADRHTQSFMLQSNLCEPQLSTGADTLDGHSAPAGMDSDESRATIVYVTAQTQ